MTDAPAAAAARRIIRAYNPYHLGDNVYNMRFFYEIREFLEDKNIIIEYFFPKKYHDQVLEFAPAKCVRIYDFPAGIDYCGADYGIRLHIGNRILPKNIFNWPNKNFDQFYVEFFNQFLRIFGLNLRITNFEFHDNRLFYLYEKLGEKYKDLDILIINSSPCSQQFFMHKPAWDDYIRRIVYMGFKVATTEKTAGVVCTADAGLTLKQIGAISMRAKVIIAINTGPLSACFNTVTFDYIRQMYVFDRGYTYAHPKIQNRVDIHEITIGELRWLTGAAAAQNMI
jgi:hypothetical protein